MRSFVIALLGLTCCASSSTTPPAAAPSPQTTSDTSISSIPAADAAPPASPQMASLEFYVGSWRCTGHSLRKNTDTPLRIEVHKVLGGSWLSVRVFVDGKQVSDEFKGYDADRKKYVHLFVDKDSSGTVVSEGWTGDHMSFLEEAPSAEPVRTVFTKLGDTSFSHKWEVDSGKGFKTVYEKTCRK